MPEVDPTLARSELERAFSHLRAGWAELIALHHNHFRLGEPGERRQGPGAWRAAQETTAGGAAVMIGKPAESIHREALERVGVVAPKALFISDVPLANLPTANRRGPGDAFILSGPRRGREEDLALESDSATRTGGPASGGPLPAEEKERERAVRPETIRHALTAWELEATRGRRPDTPRSRASLLRAHQRLRAELEERRGIPPADRSIMLGGEEGADAVLLIHGATSTPAEMRPLAEAIHAAGFSVYAPLLPTRANLAPGLGDVLWRACLQEARLRLRFLREVGPRVHVVGLSFGAAIAIHLAGEEKPQGVVLLAPALEPRLPLYVRLLLRLNVHRLQWVRRKYGWSLEVLEAMEKARPLLSRLDMPVYAAQCQDDERIAAVSLRMVQRKARHKASRFRLYPQGGHRILQIHGPAGLHAEIVDFLREI